MRPIVIEGPDGAGKSTLVRKVSEGLGRPFSHTGGATDGLDQLNRACRAQSVLMLSGEILDRCVFISDDIYKISMGQIPILPPAILVARFWTLNPVIVYCRLNSVATMKSLTVETKKAHKPPEYLEEVRKHFSEVVRRYDSKMELLTQEGFTVLGYNWMKDDYQVFERALRSCAD